MVCSLSFFGEKHALVHAACNEYIVHAAVAEPSHAALRYCWMRPRRCLGTTTTRHSCYVESK